MKSKEEYSDDLTEIRSMMQRSTRFLSLAGWSGVLAGVYALSGAWLAYKNGLFKHQDDVVLVQAAANEDMNLLLIGLAVLFLAVATAVVMASRKSALRGEKLWNQAARRLAINMAIPLATGGVFCAILYMQAIYWLILPSMLIFYGLTLLNASKFTFEEIRYLGIIEIFLGLAAAWFADLGLLLWAIGFGIMHIIYGFYLHQRYEK